MWVKQYCAERGWTVFRSNASPCGRSSHEEGPDDIQVETQNAKSRLKRRSLLTG